MTMPPEKVGVLVITAVIAILVSVTLLRNEDLENTEPTDRNQEAGRWPEGFDDSEIGVDVFELEALREGRRSTRVSESYKKRLDKKNPVRPPTSTLRHRVRKGETLGGIARQHYGKSSLWPLLARANPGLDPKKMRPGIVVVIPSLAGRRAVSQPSRRPSGRSTGPSGGEWYKVARGDSLERIARKKLGRGSAWQEIFAANRSRLKSAGSIREGQRLFIPAVPK